MYVINGKKLDLEKEEWFVVYSDGSFSSRGVRLHYREKDNKIILEEWSNWQGEVNTVKELTLKEAKEFLLNQRHQERALEAIEQMKINVDDY